MHVERQGRGHGGRGDEGEAACCREEGWAEFQRHCRWCCRGGGGGGSRGDGGLLGSAGVAQVANRAIDQPQRRAGLEGAVQDVDGQDAARVWLVFGVGGVRDQVRHFGSLWSVVVVGRGGNGNLCLADLRVALAVVELSVDQVVPVGTRPRADVACFEGR